ncbi:hypothetical protein [Jiella avicenniae]|uniref:Uncharacterized protein n=1 Tax=Jiella avicenniae TaxID=2907202 RepID=A0A9X1P215_9HYPH|nr:hypothetical protein [Jiella avicenniae]MCE7027654.1 hypothetical protein [Jiella avicenniae]MCE7028696.1 hypothetical protein [Jiella avicenniae]
MQRQQEAPAFASTDAVFQAAAAGVVVAALIQLTAALAGFGLVDGLYEAGPGLPVVSTASAFWVAASAFAFVVAGFAGARLADAHRFRDALFCGLLTFSGALIAAVVVLTLRPPSLVDRSLGPVGHAVAAMAAADRTSLPDAALDLSALRGEVLAFLDPADADDRTPGRAETSRDDSRAALATVLAGIAETADEAAVAAAVDAIEAAAGVTEPVAERRLTDWQRAHDGALRNARRSAAAATGAVSSACFSAFVALVAAMLASLLGSVLGRTRDRVVEFGA